MLNNIFRSPLKIIFLLLILIGTIIAGIVFMNTPHSIRIITQEKPLVDFVPAANHSEESPSIDE